MYEAMQNVSRVAILDAGAQYGKVIDRRCRELQVDTIMLPLNATVEEIKHHQCNAIIISGGPGSVNDPSALHFDQNIFSCGLPVLGICYGLQTFGGRVTHFERRHDGPTVVDIEVSCPLFKGLSPHEEVMLTHGDTVELVPDNFVAVSTCGGFVMAIANDTNRLYGVQFHPEVDLTINGRKMLSNFLYNIARMEPNFTLKDRQNEMIKEIFDAVGDKKVIMLLSGGVDSTVAVALLAKALKPEQIIAIHIDHGFMRENESADVMKSLKNIQVDVRLVDASRFFLLSRLQAGVDPSKPDGDILCNVIDPEEKRKIIGDCFTKTTQKEIEDTLGLTERDVFLGQGTLRPDLIESASPHASSHARVIKTHHNDTFLIRQLRDRKRVIEPLKDFHKDEVRQLGKALGLPPNIIDRHPFPGPGLAIRILCANEPYKCKDFYKINTILETMCRYHVWRQYAEQATRFLRDAMSLNDRIVLNQLTQAHNFRTILLPVRSVGVQGDERTYSYVAAIAMEDANDEDADPIRLFDKFTAAAAAELAAGDANNNHYTQGATALNKTLAATTGIFGDPDAKDNYISVAAVAIADELMQTDADNNNNFSPSLFPTTELHGGFQRSSTPTMVVDSGRHQPISMTISPTPPPLGADDEDIQPPKKARNGNSESSTAATSHRMDVDAAGANAFYNNNNSVRTPTSTTPLGNNKTMTPPPPPSSAAGDKPSYTTPLDALMQREKQLEIAQSYACAEEDRASEEVQRILQRDRQAKTKIPWHALSKLTYLITQVNHRINRVVFVFDGFDKSLTSLIQQQITPTKLRAETIRKLRTADKIATDFEPIDETLMCSMRHSVVLRPFITNDFMTGKAAIPGTDLPEEVILKMADRIRRDTPGVSRVLYDLTNKPPGTTEWE